MEEPIILLQDKKKGELLLYNKIKRRGAYLPPRVHSSNKEYNSPSHKSIIDKFSVTQGGLANFSTLLLQKKKKKKKETEVLPRGYEK